MLLREYPFCFEPSKPYVMHTSFQCDCFRVQTVGNPNSGTQDQARCTCEDKIIL
jgi:hypothetical protein